MIIIHNEPQLSQHFRDEELKAFFLNFLKNLEKPYQLKEFLVKGADKIFDEQLKQLSKSFVQLTRSSEPNTYESVIRCVDGQIFSVGDLVIDLEAPYQRALPIGRMYEDDRGLNIRLDIKEDNAITWRDLSRIAFHSHDMSFAQKLGNLNKK
jgi:hypothetical protein